MDFKPLLESLKKYGAFAILFCALFVYTINSYEKREALYMEHEQEYHKIISENNRIITEAQKQMNEQQKTLEGFRIILDVRLSNVENVIKTLTDK
jgi:hypothetical protein